MELRFTQRNVLALNALLALGLIYFASKCFIDIYSRAMSLDTAEAPPVAARPRISIGLRPRPYYDAIVKRDVFNLVPQETAPPPVVVEDLHLKLLGTSVLSKSKPYAIIEDQSGQQSLYQLGDDIPDAGKLVTVEVNRAIIDRGGRRVAIEMPSSQIPVAGPSHLGPSMVAPRSRAPGVRGMRALRRHPRAEDADEDSDPPENDDSSSLNIKKLGNGKFEASRAEVAKTMQNPAQLFSQMRALPHFVDGKPDGFSISEVAPGSVFEQIGIQNGDLLTRIDGQAVTNPMQAMGLMAAVQNRPAIDLTVDRNGSPVNLHLDLR
jgi:type II secretion system protein C